MKPYETLLLDTEDGSITVRDLTARVLRYSGGKWSEEPGHNPAGHVTVAHTPDLKAMETMFWRIRRGEITPAPQVVVIDSLTALAGTHRHKVIFQRTGINIESSSIADNMLKLGSEQRDWGTASDNLIMLLRQFRGLPLVTIFNCHERDREDESSKTKKTGPALNAMLLADVLDFTDDAFRLTAAETDLAINSIRFKRGTRFLRMAQSESHFTKIRVAPNQAVPELLDDPSLWKVKEVLKDFFPNRFVIFGPRGAGKTRFSCTLSDPEKLPKEKAA